MNTYKDNIIITISRSFGSGGKEIGKKVAEKLEIPFYDKELLAVEAIESGLAPEDLSRFDEKQITGVLYSMAFNPYTQAYGLSFDMLIQNIQEKAIKAVANQGSCVIIGRRADKILRGEYDILSVFVSAQLDNRIARVAKRDGLSEKDSKKTILKADKSRRAFYNSHGEGDWGDAANYNLCIDSGDLGVDNSAAMILQYLKIKGKLV